MKINIDLAPEAFGAHRQELFRNADFAVSTHRCTERGPMLTLANHRGALTVLPYQGLAIWDAEFDGYSLKSGRRSVKGAGRKRAGDAAFCPAGRIRTVSRCRCNACGSNWRAMSCRCTARGAGGGVGASARRCVWRRRARSSPLRCRSPTAERPQPLQYVCRLNYDCIPDAVFRQNLPAPALLGMRSGGSCCAPTICRATWIRPSSLCWRRKAGAM